MYIAVFYSSIITLYLSLKEFFLKAQPSMVISSNVH